MLGLLDQSVGFRVVMVAIDIRLLFPSLTPRAIFVDRSNYSKLFKES